MAAATTKSMNLSIPSRKRGTLFVHAALAVSLPPAFTKDIWRHGWGFAHDDHAGGQLCVRGPISQTPLSRKPKQSALVCPKRSDVS